MVTRVTAGLVINEFDFSDFATRLGLVRLACVGGATKGAVGEPIQATNISELEYKAGYPLLTDYGLIGARQFLKKGNNLVYLRVTDGTEATADRDVIGTSGGTPAVAATGTINFTATTNPLDGETITISDGTTSLVFEFDDDASFTGDVGVVIGATAAATLLNLINAINNAAFTMDAQDATVTIPELDLTNLTPGVAGNVAITETGAAIGVTGMSGGAAAIPGSSQTLMTILAKSPGTWGNGMQVIITATAQIGAPATNVDIQINAVVDEAGKREVVERFLNCSLDSTSSRYIETVVEQGVLSEVRPSEYIEVDVILDGTPDPDTYTLGEGGGAVGSDGIAGLDYDDYIGTLAGPNSTGLKALRNPEAVEFNMLAVPGVSHNLVIDEIINATTGLAVARGDFFYLPDPPIGLDPDEIKEWHNGLSILPNAPVAALNSSYAGLCWAWQYQEEEYNKVNIWMPPSGMVAANSAESDENKGPWFPVAGHNRGILLSQKTEYSPSYPEREELAGGINRINSIVDFIGQGPTLFGNRTLLRTESALSNWHVRRMLLRAEKLCASSTKFLIFEPNDPITWKKFELLCNPILANIASQRGIEVFRVRCDESTNPVQQRTQRRMKGKLSVKPYDIAEVLELDFAIYASYAEFTETT